MAKCLLSMDEDLNSDLQHLYIISIYMANVPVPLLLNVGNKDRSVVPRLRPPERPPGSREV